VNIRVGLVPRASGFVGGKSGANISLVAGKYGLPEGSTYPRGPGRNRL
jgi:hypothetical protein